MLLHFVLDFGNDYLSADFQEICKRIIKNQEKTSPENYVQAGVLNLKIGIQEKFKFKYINFKNVKFMS